MFCDRRAYWFVGINDKSSKYSAYYFDLNKLLKKESVGADFTFSLAKCLFLGKTFWLKNVACGQILQTDKLLYSSFVPLSR